MTLSDKKHPKTHFQIFQLHPAPRVKIVHTAYGGFHSHGGKPKWMVYFMDNPDLKWMMTGGTPMTSETTKYPPTTNHNDLQPTHKRIPNIFSIQRFLDASRFQERNSVPDNGMFPMDFSKCFPGFSHSFLYVSHDFSICFPGFSHSFLHVSHDFSICFPGFSHSFLHVSHDFSICFPGFSHSFPNVSHDFSIFFTGFSHSFLHVSHDFSICFTGFSHSFLHVSHDFSICFTGFSHSFLHVSHDFSICFTGFSHSFPNVSHEFSI